MACSGIWPIRLGIGYTVAYTQANRPNVYIL